MYTINTNSIYKPFSIIFNKSFERGIIPKPMKIAKVIPIYKCKENNEMDNYRPISLLPSISKIIEKLVHKRLLSFCENNKMLNDNQYGLHMQCFWTSPRLLTQLTMI